MYCFHVRGCGEVEAETFEHSQSRGVAFGGFCAHRCGPDLNGLIQRCCHRCSSDAPTPGTACQPHPGLQQVRLVSALQVYGSDDLSLDSDGPVALSGGTVETARRSRWKSRSQAIRIGVQAVPEVSGGVTSSAETSVVATCTCRSSTTSPKPIRATSRFSSTTPEMLTGPVARGRSTLFPAARSCSLTRCGQAGR